MIDYNSKSYKQYLAQLHQERTTERAQEVMNALQTAQEEMNDAIHYRDQGVQEGVSYEERRARDRVAIEAENHYRQTHADAVAATPWYSHPAVQQLYREYKPWFDDYGQNAWNALQREIAYSVRPRIAGETDPNKTGCGESYDEAASPAGMQRIRERLKEYAGARDGAPFDPEKHKVPTWRDVVKVSGLTEADCKRGYEIAKRAGEFSWQKKR